MRRLLYLAALSMMAILMLAPAALAQSPSEGDLYDCGDFTFQEDAQAQLLAGDPYGLDDDGDGMACDNLPSRGGGTGGEPTPQQPTTPTMGGGNETTDLDCADFATQADAQAVYNQDPSDPTGLDTDFDGIACEEGEDGTTTTQYQPTATTEQYTPAAPQTPAQPQAPAMMDLPSTGGPALLIPAAGLLLATGLIGMRMVRRRS